MPITKLRGNLQVKENTLGSDRIKDRTITAVDVAVGSLDGSLFIDGSIPAIKIDVPSFAGEGIVYNPTTNKLDLNVNIGDFQIVLDTLEATANLTQWGNVFNGPDQLVKNELDGRLPALDGSNLTNLFGLTLGFVDMETPAGAINNANVVFTLANTPATGSLHLFLNGVLQRPGPGNDYTVTGNVVTFTAAPSSGSYVCASYRA